MPIARAEQYYHAILRRSRFRTFAILKTSPASEQLAAIAEETELEVDPEILAAAARFDAMQ